MKILKFTSLFPCGLPALSVWETEDGNLFKRAPHMFSGSAGYKFTDQTYRAGGR